MIVWINGAFGSGKTSVAFELARRLGNAFAFDPEEAGFYIRRNIPKTLDKPDFQDFPQWREINRQMINFLSGSFDGVLIVPMTVTDNRYLEEIAGGLDVRHFILTASRETLLRRLRSRGEGRSSWAAKQIDRCAAAFSGDMPGERINSDGVGIGEIVDIILAKTGLPARADTRGTMRKRLDRLAVKLRHIR